MHVLVQACPGPEGEAKGRAGGERPAVVAHRVVPFGQTEDQGPVSEDRGSEGPDA